MLTPVPVQRRGDRHLLLCDFGRKLIPVDAPAWNVGGLLACTACLPLALKKPLRMIKL